MGVLVDVGVGSKKSLLLGDGQGGHAVYIVVAVAFDMGDAEQVDEGEVLLH